MGAVRRVCRNLKRWRNAAMALRWTAAGCWRQPRAYDVSGTQAAAESWARSSNDRLTDEDRQPQGEAVLAEQGHT